MGYSEAVWFQPGFKEAFIADEREERIRSGKIGCALVICLMPIGVALDLFVYPERWAYLLKLRLLCSVLAAGLWFLHTTSWGLRYYRLLGVPIAILPAFFIAWMIAVTEGPYSPYYAGLILIILAVNAFAHWTTAESFLAMAMLFLLYLLACLPWNITDTSGIFFNNIYFLLLTGIIVVTGNYLYNELHFREFVLRYELGQKRRELEKTNQKLIELDHIKSRFFANISHELRTPLTLLLAPLESLMRERGSTLESATGELLSTMHSHGMRLLKLINDLLDLVRLESGKMEVRREPVPIETFLRGLGNAMRKTADDRRISLETTVDDKIGVGLIDADKLEKILLNLLFNAVKFTPAGGRIRLHAGRQNDELVLEILDTGIGINEEKIRFVFDRFWQADTSSQKNSQGVGIGLALVKELVEIQGGKVEVASRPGKGTRFTVRLPCPQFNGEPEHTFEPVEAAGERPSSPAAGETNGDSGTWLRDLYRRAELFPAMASLQATLRPLETFTDGSRPRVLIADDEPDMLKYLKSQLSRHFQVLEAVDGREAVDKASQFLPDVMVCDMMMPQKDGLQVCRELRQQTSTQAIPIILLTARADEETKLAVLSAGANDFITKPFSTTELTIRLKNLVDARRLQQELAQKNQLLEATLEQLKETEAQLLQSEKLASLGKMSAGIIHEVNNPLGFAKTGLYILRKKTESLAADEKAGFQDILQDVEDGINRIVNIVSDLRTFSKPHVTQMEMVFVTKVVDFALRFLSNEWRDKVRIEKTILPDQTIWANPNEATQVLLNVVQNALHAVKEKSHSEEAPTIWISSYEDGGDSLIAVRDNGAGIPPENLYKIFDPFFTTKDVGEGMGLGLSICYRIMEQHRGRIEVRSEPGKYSEFLLRFKARQPNSPAVQSHKESSV
jgi:signal transduction histidine kinase